MDTIKRPSKAIQVASEIQHAIKTGVHRAGERLGTKEDLRARYSVAFGTLNEALRVLQSRGYVVGRSGPKGGVFVSARTPRRRNAA